MPIMRILPKSFQLRTAAIITILPLPFFTGTKHFLFDAALLQPPQLTSRRGAKASSNRN